jgi:hypothetical protein
MFQKQNNPTMEHIYIASYIKPHRVAVGSEFRVARWYVFKPKIPIWLNFGRPWNGKCWHILWPFGNLVALWYIFPRLGKLCREKSLATLVPLLINNACSCIVSNGSVFVELTIWRHFQIPCWDIERIQSDVPESINVRLKLRAHVPRVRHREARHRRPGCQIFLGTTYQNFCPLGWTFPQGVNFVTYGECSPLRSPPGVNTLYCLEEQRGEQRISPPGDNFTARVKIHPLGTTSPLGSKFAHRGEVKNGPQQIMHSQIIILRLAFETIAQYFI